MPKAKTLIITGAGASAELGHDDAGMPLMADWAARLCKEVGADLAEMSTLNAALSGPDFEETLGALFRFAETLDDAHRFAGMARQYVGSDRTWQNSLDQAISFAHQNIATFMTRLHHSLFQNFGPARIDADKARRAYDALFDRLGIEVAHDEVVFATTNYDRSIELAFRAAQVPIRNGFVPDNISTPSLDPIGLGTFDPGRPSIIYLHGAVGWYRSGDSIISMPADRGFQDVHGAPAVLYPGPDKDVGRVETKDLWDEFVAAIEAADRILVLGHSLHDDHLVAALRNATVPVAVTYYSMQKPTAESAAEADEQETWITARLPEALPVAARLGPKPSLDGAALDRWLQASKAVDAAQPV